MLKRTLILGGLISLTSSLAVAGEFNLQFNDDAVKAEVSEKLYQDWTFSAAYHHAEDEGNLISLGAKTAHSNNYGNFALGGKFVGVDLKSNDYDNAYAIALGGDYSTALAPDLNVYMSGYYSPSVLSSGDLDGFAELNTGVDYTLMPTASVQLGYKLYRLDYEEFGHAYFDKSIYAGLNFKF